MMETPDSKGRRDVVSWDGPNMQAFLCARLAMELRGCVVVTLKPKAAPLAEGDLVSEFADGILPYGHMLQVVCRTIRRDWELQLYRLNLPDREREHGEKFYRCKLVSATQQRSGFTPMTDLDWMEGFGAAREAIQAIRVEFVDTNDYVWEKLCRIDRYIRQQQQALGHRMFADPDEHGASDCECPDCLRARRHPEEVEAIPI